MTIGITVKYPLLPPHADSPWGTLPFLEVDGKIIGGSTVIARFLAERFGTLCLYVAYQPWCHCHCYIISPIVSLSLLHHITHSVTVTAACHPWCHCRICMSPMVSLSHLHVTHGVTVASACHPWCHCRIYMSPMVSLSHLHVTHGVTVAFTCHPWCYCHYMHCTHWCLHCHIVSLL